jgi:hypothetical protein
MVTGCSRFTASFVHLTLDKVAQLYLRASRCCQYLLAEDCYENCSQTSNLLELLCCYTLTWVAACSVVQEEMLQYHSDGTKRVTRLPKNCLAVHCVLQILDLLVSEGIELSDSVFQWAMNFGLNE